MLSLASPNAKCVCLCVFVLCALLDALASVGILDDSPKMDDHSPAMAQSTRRCSRIPMPPPLNDSPVLSGRRSSVVPMPPADSDDDDDDWD